MFTQWLPLCPVGHFGRRPICADRRRLYDGLMAFCASSTFCTRRYLSWSPDLIMVYLSATMPLSCLPCPPS